ncbi:MAG: hypothetical protein P4L84_11300 [Isosphaeraceae bacterium]|nr:hypothetical protein [Isosphaeraceae bacterium]
MPFYWLTTTDTDGECAYTPFAAPDDHQAVRDGLAAVNALRAAGFDRIASATIDTLEIGSYDPTTGEISTTRNRRLYDSADPDSSITVVDLPTAASLGLAHGQRPDAPKPPVCDGPVFDLPPRPQQGRTTDRAVSADFRIRADDFEEFEEFEEAEIGITAQDRFRRRGDH